MPAASGADADAVAAAAAHGGLRVGGLGGGHDGERPWGARCDVAEVAHGGEQERGVRRGRRGRGGTPAPTRQTRNASVASKTEATAMLPLERAQMAASTTSWYKIPGMIEDLSPKEQN